MVKIRLFSFVLLLNAVCLCPSFSQEINVTTGNHEIISSIARIHKIFGHDKEYFYLIRYSGTQYFISKLDDQMNTVLEEPLKLFKGLRTYEFQTIVHFYNALYLFVAHYRINDITLYYQKIDKSSLQPLTELIEITTVKNIKGSWADFHFALSRNETKLMIASRIKLSWSRAQFNEFYVFGEDLSLVWRRKDSYEFQGQGPRDNEYVVDETGNVTILSLLKRESIISLFSEQRNVYVLYRYTNQGEDFREYPVSLNDKYIRGIKIIGTPEGELVCAGLYSEKFKTGMRGTFYFTLDAETGEVMNFNLNAFDEAVLAELTSLKEPMINDEEVISYMITDLVLRPDNKVIMIAEQMFHQSYDTFNNLIISSYDLLGQVYWTRIIPKNQNFSYTSIAFTGIDLIDFRDYVRETGFISMNVENYASYALMAPIDKPGIILFYNDHIKNMNSDGVGRSFSHPKKSYLLAISIDEFGNIKRKPLIAWKKKSLYPEPMRYYDTLHETIIVPASRSRSVNFYKISALF